jgi:phosphoribosylformylglycinamidine synthase
MPRYEVQVEVTHRPGILDPAGATLERALPALGWANVAQVRIGKSIRLVIEAADAAAATAQVDEMCTRILTNPVIEDYELHVQELSRT